MKTLSRVVHSADPRSILSLQDELLTKVNPALRKEVLDGVLTERITLTDQWQLFSHGLGRTPVGWIAVEPQWAEPTWTAPTLLNSWTDVGGTDQPTQYRVAPGGAIELRGRVKNGTVGNAFFTLPAAYWPTYHYHIINLCEDGGGNRAPYHMNVSTNGNVTPYQVGAAFYTNYVVIHGRFHPPGAPTQDIEETETSNPDRSRFLRLRTCNSGSTTKLWVF